MSMSRRRFLGGVATATAAGAVASLSPLRNVFASGGTGCKFLFIVEGNCYEPRTILAPSARAALDDGAVDGEVGDARWWYRRYRHDTALDIPGPDLAMAPALGGLEEFGVADRATAIFGLSSRIVGGGHSAYHGALSSTRTLSNRAGGQTIDAYLAGLETVRGDAPFEAARMNVGPGPLNFGTCAAARALSLPMINDPLSAYQVLYGAFSEGAGAQAFAQQEQLLRFLREDVQAAAAEGRLDPAEVRKLELYGESIEELQYTQMRLQEMSVTPPTAPADDLTPLPRFGAMLDLASGALIDGLTNVAVVGSGAGGPFSLTYSSVSSVGRHDMHHGSAGDATLRQNIVDITRLQVREIARTARRLADAGILDRTIIVFIGDNGEQHHSTASEFPVLLIGGGGDIRPGGRTVVYPGISSPNHRQVSNLWNTLGYAAGATLDEFGGEDQNNRVARGPLGEILV